MNSPDPNNVNIRIEISVPTRGRGGLIDFRSPPSRDLSTPPMLTFFIPIEPLPNATKPVRPMPGTNLGAICAAVEYDSGNRPDEVKVQVYPFSLAHDDLEPPPTAITGDVFDSGRLWKWEGSKELPGADYGPSAPGHKNVMFVWRRDGAVWSPDGSVDFFGVMGTTGPCGTGSGSGSGTGGGMPMLGGKLYPAVWCATFEKFPDALGMFNAIWALRQVPGAPVPTWNNAGDGVQSVKVHLTLQKNVWELTIALGTIKAVYSTPVRGGTFGPIAFPATPADVPKIGKVSLPPGRVVAM